MRVLVLRVASLVALVAMAAALLSGCELREGVDSEYGKASGVSADLAALLR
jgi:hypothetical protein